MPLKKNIRYSLFALAMFLCVSEGTFAQDPIQWKAILTDTTHLKRTIGHTYRAFPVPAIGAGPFRSDTLLAARLEGLHKWPNGNLINEHNYFHLGGNSMGITSYIAGRLVEAGKLTWNTSFFDVFPALKKERIPAIPISPWQIYLATELRWPNWPAQPISSPFHPLKEMPFKSELNLQFGCYRNPRWILESTIPMEATPWPRL